MNTWWGYKHTDGSLQAKRYFDDQSIKDAYLSPFVARVVGVFEANSREEALAYIAKQTSDDIDTIEI